MRGRKPKPTFLKLVAGNPGRRPLNPDEPQPVGDLTDPPEWMNETQRQCWRYAIESAPPGLLKRLDRSVLAVWVVAEDLHRTAAEAIDKFGAIVNAPMTGTPMQSPYISVLNQQAKIMLRAAAEMGFTPSSRSRVRVTEGTPREANKFSELRERGEE